MLTRKVDAVVARRGLLTGDSSKTLNSKMSDCSICFNDITGSTGRTVLGCGHEFHLKCVVTWLQREDGAGTCPCCRAEPGELEQIRASVGEEDYDDDESVSTSDSVTGITPLMEAASIGDCDEINRLIAAGADMEERDSEGDTALCYTVINGHEAATKEFLRLGADLMALSTLCPDNEEDDTSYEHAFHGACNYTSVPCIAAVLDRGVDVNCVCPGSDGSLPLTTVIRSEQESEEMLAAIRFLMKRGADPHRVDCTGWNTFMWFANYQLEDYEVMRAMAPPVHAPGVLMNAALKIQGVWRMRSCARILTRLSGLPAAPFLLSP